jgi:plasmid rolling circle replication initiator protein Rep
VFYSVINDNSTKLLQDAREIGRENDWKGYKSRSSLMAEHLLHAADKYDDPSSAKKAKRMAECCNVLTFKLTDKGLKLYQAYMCKGRLCSMCNWRRSLKITYQNKRIIEKANQDHKLRWVFLTLTQKNCKGSELNSQIDAMMKAWKDFAGYRKIKQVMKGFFRTLEITKDWDEYVTKKRYYSNPAYYKRQGLRVGDPNPNYKTYHPHFHVLMCVPPSYFSRGYIKRQEWRDFWQKAMKLDYSPIVDVRIVKAKKETKSLEEIEEEIKVAVLEREIEELKAIKEVSKYAIKHTDVLPVDHLTADGIETAYVLTNATAYRRLISYGGILKQIRKQLNLDDAEDGDLVKVGDEDEEANTICEVIAYWNPGIKNYVIKSDVIDTETGEIL